MHPTVEQVQRFLHGELSPAAVEEVRAHLASCADCRAAVAAAGEEERLVFQLLGVLDHPMPRRTAPGPAPLLAGRAARRAGTAGAWARRAAVALLALGVGGAAWAAPRSPLRDWLAGWARDAEPHRDRAVAASGESASDDSLLRGIAVEPGDRFTIAFPGTSEDGGVALVTLTDGPELVVRASGGDVSFASDVDRLVVGGGTAATRIEIRVPRDAPLVEVRVGDRRVFLKDGARVVADSAEGATYRLPLGRVQR